MKRFLTRRDIIKTGAILPLAPTLLSGCDNSNRLTNAFYEDGVYLSGNFKPVSVESTLTELEVIGSIPEELTGRFLRNGSNPHGQTDADSYHWFTGDGMVHGLRLDNGKADWYRNRWVRSESIIKALGESVDGRELGFGPNTNVIGHGGKTWAIVESGSRPIELSYTLDTIGQNPGWGGYTAHPKIDPDTGELHAISYDWGNYRDHVKYTVMDVNAKLIKEVDIPLPGMPMLHDMSLTKNYIVLFDLPVTVSLMALGTGSDFPFRWDDEHEPRVGVMPRNGTGKDIVWSSIGPNYSYHPLNAYEDENGQIVVDICRYEKMFAADTNGPFGDSLPRLDRWTINPKGGKVSEQIIDERPQEFPRCHPDLNSKPYQYGYVLSVGNQTFPSIYKQDLKSGTSTEFKFGPGRHGAEPNFIPKQSAQSEDDGYLMTFVYDEQRGASELIILDARDLSRPALAKIKLPVRVPYGFHGNWVPDTDVS